MLTQIARYEKAFVDFFEDELVRFGYDWKQVVEEYLFSGKEPVFNSVIADCMSLSRNGCHPSSSVY